MSTWIETTYGYTVRIPVGMRLVFLGTRIGKSECPGLSRTPNVELEKLLYQNKHEIYVVEVDRRNLQKIVV